MRFPGRHRGGRIPASDFGPIENAPADGRYPAGTIAMARAAGDAYSQGHQFFIMYGDGTIDNDAAGGYTVIGHVTSGLDKFVTDIANAGVAGDSHDGAPGRRHHDHRRRDPLTRPRRSTKRGAIGLGDRIGP